MKFGDNLKIIRKSRKISQEDLADTLGVSRQSVSKWETGENYPSMQNIVCLCSIFKCKMNDLVHEDFVDLDSLDEEVKMNVVKLNKKEQKNVKILSKILEIMAKIGAIITKVAIVFVALAMIAIPIFIKNIDIEEDRIVAAGEVIKITEVDNGVKLTAKDNEKIVYGDINNKDIEKIKNSYEHFSKPVLIGLLESSLVVLVVFLVLLTKVFEHIYKLFANIHDGDTPFTLDNVNHIKKMSYYMIGAIITSGIGATILDIAISADITIDIDGLSLMQIIFLFALSYIFEYGYHIQKDSKGKLYGDPDE